MSIPNAKYRAWLIHQALEQIASKQAEVDRLRTDAANLRAEKEQWQVSLRRLCRDVS